MITTYFKPKPKPAVPPPPKPRGCPWKKKTTASPKDQPPAKKAKEAGADEKPPIQKRVDYSDPAIKAALDEAVDYYIATKKYPTAIEASLSHQPLMIFPKSMIRDHARMRNKEATMSAPTDCLNLGGNQMFHKHGSSKSLTTPLMQEFIGNTIKVHDEAQNGMPHKEVIQLRMRLMGAKKKTCENHFDFLICMEKFPQLKNYGRVQTVQATTTKRACICVKQQLRWHNTIQNVLEDHRLFNQPADKFLELQHYFQLNLDKTCIMGSLGSLKIVGSTEVKKHKRITDDNREAITIVCVGSVGGHSGPWIFLVEKQKDFEKNSPFQNLEAKFHGVPPGSLVVATPNAYTTNET